MISMAGLNDLRGHFQPTQFCDFAPTAGPMIQNMPRLDGKSFSIVLAKVVLHLMFSDNPKEHSSISVMEVTRNLLWHQVAKE